MDSVLKVAVMLSAVDKMTAVIKSATNSGIKDLTRLSKEANKISRSAFDLGRNAGMFGLAIAAPLGMAVNAAAKYEQMNVSLKTAFQGNEKAANDAFKVINDFAQKTPYELQEVMTGFVKLKNMGLDPSIEALTAYGNTASSMGKSLNDMVEAVADAATNEFERLKEFGIKAKSQGDKVSFTFQGVTTTVGKNAAQIEKYLKNIGLTKFAGGIEAQSKTFNGQLSTLKDNVTLFAASIGNVLIPILNDLMQRVQPVLSQIKEWTDQHPELTKYIVLGTAAIGAAALAVSALSFAFGGLMKVVSIVSNPTFLAIAGIALAVYLIYRNWEGITKWFSDLWESIKNIFSPALAFIGKVIYDFTPIGWFMRLWKPLSRLFSALWDLVKSVFTVAIGFIKAILLNFTPIGLIVKHWDKLSDFFSKVWDKVKAVFTGMFDWVWNWGARFYEAGANIIQSIIDGISSKVNYLADKIKGVAKDIRDFFPFSPAKRGPLMDIHRIKLIETIAGAVKPRPLIKAMDAVTGAVMNSTPRTTGLSMAIAGGGGGFSGGFQGGSSKGVVVNFNPVFNMSGRAGDAKTDILKALREYEGELMRIIDNAVSRRDRKKFG